MKALVFDIETRPMLGFSWSYYFRGGGKLIDLLDYDGILTISYGWVGKKRVKNLSIHREKGYKPFYIRDKYGFRWNHNEEAEKNMLTKFWEIHNEADFLIGQNIDKFDLKKLNTKYEKYGLGPIPYKPTFDTQKSSKKHFDLPSHRLDFKAKYFGGKGKRKHEGWDMWLGFLENDKRSIREMIKYNDQDIKITIDEYYRDRKWAGHPNLGMLGATTKEEDFICGVCLSKNVIKNGQRIRGMTVYQELKCKDCGSYPAVPIIDADIKKLLTAKRKNIGR